MPGLLKVGELPPVRRSPGRKKGKWRGNEEKATELQHLAKRETRPEKRWGMVAEQLPSRRAQSIAGAIKRGEAVGWEKTPEGQFEAFTRQCENEVRGADPTKPMYDVWARWVPAE